MDSEQIKLDYNLYKIYYKELQKEVYDFLQELKERTKSVDVESIIQRPGDKIKEIDSILKNIQERSDKYKGAQQLTDIKDIAGNRITCHCQSDREKLFDILDGELKQRYVDVIGDKKEGVYRAYHFNFAKEFTISGKTQRLYGEIQLRTVLGNAWAVQDTKYIYKNKLGQGEPQTLSKVVSDILYGCEGLWDLVKAKSTDNGAQAADLILHAQKATQEKIEETKKTIQTAAKIKPDVQTWFDKHQARAVANLQAAGIISFMEVKMYLPNTALEVQKTELKEAARHSTIDTFGWPIAVFIDNRDEYKPKPDANGIVAELAIKRPDWVKPGVDEKTYDYWTLNQNGSFYLLTSLFEDLRKSTHLFFDTRTVRITETLMYASNVYSKLGVGKEDPIIISIRHGGIKGRIMGSAGNRLINWERKSIENEVVTTVQTSLKEIEQNLSVVVTKFTTPLFEMFDFFAVGKNVIEDIVTKFKNGVIA